MSNDPVPRQSRRLTGLAPVFWWSLGDSNP